MRLDIVVQGRVRRLYSPDLHKLFDLPPAQLRTRMTEILSDPVKNRRLMIAIVNTLSLLVEQSDERQE